MSDISGQHNLKLDGGKLLEQIQTLGDLRSDKVVGGRTRIALTDSEKAGEIWWCSGCENLNSTSRSTHRRHFRYAQIRKERSAPRTADGGFAYHSNSVGT